MSICRVETPSNTTTPVQTPLGSPCQYAFGLDDYMAPYLEMDEKLKANSKSKTDEENDVYALLAQKERDLVLAAELGKALLDTNEELKRKCDALSEENSQKMEEITQEKHGLKLQLENLKSEYDVTVRELKEELNLVRSEMTASAEHAMQGNKSRAQIVQELTSQNERLTEELRKASQKEDALIMQVNSLRNNAHKRRLSTADHVNQMEIMRQEVMLSLERRNEIEKRLEDVGCERDLLLKQLEDANTGLMGLEKLNHEKDQRIKHQEVQIHDLHEQYVKLKETVAAVAVSPGGFEQCTASLFSELNLSMGGENGRDMAMSTDSITETSDDLSTPNEPTSLDQELAFGGGLTQRRLLPGSSLDFPLFPDDDEDGIECDDDVMITSYLSSKSQSDSQSQVVVTAQINSDNYQLKQEIVEVYRQMRDLVSELEGAVEERFPEAVHLQDVKAGSLLAAMSDLRGYVMHRINESAAGGSFNSNDDQLDLLEQRLETLQAELDVRETQISRLKADIHNKEAKLKQKGEEVNHMQNKMKLAMDQLSSQHDELVALQTERDHLQDRSAGITRDDIVDQTRDERNKAIQRRNEIEMELECTKLEVMNLDSQLMESVQQKIELQQQLDQWQVDMHELIGAQVNKRLVAEERKDKKSNSSQNTASPKRTRFPFFFKNGSSHA